MLRNLYDWVMRWAEHPKSFNLLCLLAFVESIFFPIPVDPFLMAVAAAKPKKAIWYSLAASLFSVLGGLAGYLLGYLFWEGSHEFFFTYIFPQEKFNLVLEEFKQNAFLAMFLAGFTPIPFKVFTLAAGVAQIALLPFILGSIVSRTLRFSIEGMLIYFWGPSIRKFTEDYFDKITLSIGVIIVIGVTIYKVSL